MTPQDWITALETEESPSSFKRSIIRRIRAKIPEADIRQSGADNKVVRDYVSHRLNVLWCDPIFWKMLKKIPSAPEIQHFIEKRHKLCLPPFDQTVWRAMVADRISRECLFRVLRARPGTFTKARLTDDAKDALEELKSGGAEKLLIHYIQSPGVSKRGLLRWFKLSDSTLRELAEGAKRLLEDISWCLVNKNDAKPEPAFFVGRGNPKSPEDVMELEDMVTLVRGRRFDTNQSNARKYLERLKRDLSKITDNEVKNYAVLAGRAKILVEFREGLPVKWHVDPEKNIGLKPRRRRFGEK